MHTLLVPAMLAALIGAWLPAQLTEVASTLTEISCELQSARLVDQASNCHHQSERAQVQVRPATAAGTLAWLTQWQNIADI